LPSSPKTHICFEVQNVVGYKDSWCITAKDEKHIILRFVVNHQAKGAKVDITFCKEGTKFSGSWDWLVLQGC